jgi:hypothetical protein
VTEDTYLLDRKGNIAIVRNGTVATVAKWVYTSSKGRYIRVNTGNNNYTRVYIDEVMDDAEANTV